VQLSIGRGQRAASLLERYINHFTVGVDAYEYVGNPNLESEANNQVDLSVRDIVGKFQWRANVFYSFLQNYISAEVDEDLPRKYMPGTEPLYAKRFINIDKAWQTGFDVGVGYSFTKSLSMNVGAYYTYAQNMDFDEPLPEIPPLTGLVSIRFNKPSYWLEFKGRFVAEQSRVAESFDESASPGFNVFDLMAAYTPVKSLDINFALRNIFDTNYFEHLSRPYKNQTEKSMLYEPGRSFRIGLRYRF
jgi:iron complex outermembrane receptor protein